MIPVALAPGGRPSAVARAAGAVARAAVLVALLVAGCSQPGTQVSASEAAKLDVATNRISVACGYTEELGGHPSPEQAWVESIAVSGAQKLAAVFARDQSHIYQGESIGAIVHDSISLLDNCRLPRARALLQGALARDG